MWQTGADRLTVKWLVQIGTTENFLWLGPEVMEGSNLTDQPVGFRRLLSLEIRNVLFKLLADLKNLAWVLLVIFVLFYLHEDNTSYLCITNFWDI